MPYWLQWTHHFIVVVDVLLKPVPLIQHKGKGRREGGRSGGKRIKRKEEGGEEIGKGRGGKRERWKEKIAMGDRGRRREGRKRQM